MSLLTTTWFFSPASPIETNSLGSFLRLLSILAKSLSLIKDLLPEIKTVPFFF
tara:strand:- start:284 stop:442 length:159 start_codon:yes stop_codon:yes gene_type:complete